jgi:hypothetical protein
MPTQPCFTAYNQIHSFWGNIICTAKNISITLHSFLLYFWHLFLFSQELREHINLWWSTSEWCSSLASAYLQLIHSKVKCSIFWMASTILICNSFRTFMTGLCLPLPTHGPFQDTYFIMEMPTLLGS